MRSPPTSLETQLRVIQASVNCRSSRSCVGQRDLPVDHAVDAQRPVLRLDRGHDDRGVDPVEVAVAASCHGRDALDADAVPPAAPAASVDLRQPQQPADSSTCRRPRPTTRPATPSATAAPAAITPARITKPAAGSRSETGRPAPATSASAEARRARGRRLGAAQRLGEQRQGDQPGHEPDRDRERRRSRSHRAASATATAATPASAGVDDRRRPPGAPRQPAGPREDHARAPRRCRAAAAACPAGRPGEMRYSASRPGVSRMTSSATATTGDSRIVIAIATK